MSSTLVFAQVQPTRPSPLAEINWMILLVVAVVVILFGFFMLLIRRYKRCPSNKVLVIYGKVGGGRASRCLQGGAAFVVPVVQDYAFLSLEPMSIEIPLKGALSAENIRINVPSVFTVGIGTDPEVMGNAANRLLHLTTEEIKQLASDIILGQMRQVIASMHIEEINRDRDKFLQNIQTSLEPELKKIGLMLINVNITDLTDESGYIEAIGRKAAAQAIQKAKIEVAEQEKLGQIGVAEAERERAISVANANKLREIGTREAVREQTVRLAQIDREQQVGQQTAALERDAQIKEAQRQQAVRIAQLDKEQKVGEQQAAFEREAQVREAERAMRIRLAELEKEQKIGEQQAAFERDAQIKEAERAMRIAVAEANAKAIAGESQAQAAIAAAQAQLQVKQAEAYQIGETRKREAEAAVQEAQNRALAKAALAQAERVEAERRAALEAPAKAEKAKTIVEAEAEAEKRRIEAEGQAAAIFARLEAEARGQYEMLAKKADGLKRIVDACRGPQQAFQLLMLEHLDKLAETAALAISNIKFDKVIVWENGSGNGSGSNTSHFLQNLARSLPPMMQIMKDIGGVELPEYVARFTTEGRPEARPNTAKTSHEPEAEASVPPKG